MELKFIGYGGTFDYPLINSSMLLNYGPASILIDCGHSVYGRLRELDLVEKLTHVYITHLHDDHCGSLATLIFHRYFKGGGRLTLLYPDEIFLDLLKSFLKFSMPDPDRYVSFEPLSSVGDLQAIDTTNRHMDGIRSYALLVREAGQTDIVITGDLYEFDYLVRQLEKIGVKKALVFADTAYANYGGAHTWYKTLEKYLDRFEIISYHNNPSSKPADCRIPFVTERPEYIWNK